jgi:membrane-associated protease RseP (regulator of RpoE activity)
MIGRELSLTLVLALTAVAPALAQVAGTRCAAQDAVGFIGISGVDCNCTIGSRDPDAWAFRTEPRITSLEANTTAGKVLRIGDVITHINGQLITTREGARAMAGIKPGEAVVLTVRRNRETLRFALTAEASCKDDPRLGMYAPSQPAGQAPRASAVTPRPSTKPGQAARRGSAVAPVVASTGPLRTRGSFGMGLMCSASCEIKGESNGVLHFSEPPEVYSVERGSGADKAGIRRGDVITHVNGRPITSKEGGRIFGTAKPGATLGFTVRRDGKSRTVSLTAAPRTAPAPALARSSEALVQAQKSLRELEREQQRQLQKIQEEIRRSQAEDDQRLRELQREFLRQEQEHRRKLTQLSTELARAESRMRTALADSARNSCAVVNTTPRASGGRTLRYTGLLGDSEIEVRGANPVSVTETDEEVTISAGSTTVKVKKARK